MISSIVYAGLIDAIAIKVNDDIITLADIDNKMQALHVDKPTAVNTMVDDMLFDQEIKKNFITVDDIDIENYMMKIAASNNMTLSQFKEAVKAQTNFDIFKNDIKTKLLKQKLSQKILAGKLRYASDEDTKIYYDNNQDLFSVASKIDVIKYSSNDQQLLAQVLNNPMFFNENIKRENQTIDMKTASSNIRYLLNGINNGKFTKIAKDNSKYMMFFVKEKKEISVLEYEKVKNKIFEIIMKDRENQFLKTHFSQLRLEADIEVIR
jgi:hypothetical protein